MRDDHSICLPVLYAQLDPTNQSTGKSAFKEMLLSIEDYNGLFITPRISALNLRHRLSKPGYYSDWHMAGDPTLLIIRSGQLRVGLRDGNFRDFTAGDMFVAQDSLQTGEMFDPDIHGHNAQVIGEQNVLAVHIKLASLVI